MATFGTFIDGVSLKASELNSFFERKTYAPDFTQGVTLSDGLNVGRYYVVNKLVIFLVRWSSNSSGTAGSAIEMTLPVAAVANTGCVIGTAYFNDASPEDFIVCRAVQISTTKVAFVTQTATSTTTYLGQTNGPNVTVTVSDALHVMLMYEAA